MNKREGEIFFKFNFFPKNRKGLSTIVITLILIVLSLVAIGIIWIVVRNLINASSDQIGGLSQFTISLDITNAYEQSGNITVNVLRNVGAGDLIKIKFVLSDGTNSEVITENTTLPQLESATFVLQPSELNAANVLTVSIAPVFKSSDGKEIIGNILDTFYLANGVIPGTQGNQTNQSSGCTPNCAGMQCGLDPICSEICGICSGGSTCINNKCVSPGCNHETSEETCGTWICGVRVNNCGELISCGSECPSRQMCDNGICVPSTPLNAGVVQETWPGTSAMYFGSSDLPTDTNYENDYIKFLESNETDCLLIVIYRFPVTGYNKSHIGFDFETRIATGNDYYIFQTLNACQSY